jgi:hypothetical protein
MFGSRYALSSGMDLWEFTFYVAAFETMNENIHTSLVEMLNGHMNPYDLIKYSNTMNYKAFYVRPIQ